MKILAGKQILDVDGETFRAAAGRHANVLVDIGAGSGRFVYEVARRRPEWLCVGVDAERRGLRSMALRAARKPSRGGLSNVIFVMAAAEDLPEELTGVASHVCINLPWGSLLRGAALVEPALFEGIRRIAAPGAVFDMVVAYSAKYEPRMMADLGLPPLSPQYVREEMAPACRERGVEILRTRVLSNAVVGRIPLGWGRALSRKRRRDFFHIVARIGPASGADAEARSVLADFIQPPDLETDLSRALRFRASGHPSIVAAHPVSIEFTREKGLTERGDCIVGVDARFDPGDVAALLDYRKLHVILRTENAEDRFDCRVNTGFCDPDEIVFRKSGHRSTRTLGVHASKSAAQLSRFLVADLRSPGAGIEVTLWPARRGMRNAE